MIRLRLWDLDFKEKRKDVWCKKYDLGSITVYIPEDKNDVIPYTIKVGSQEIEGGFRYEDFDKAMYIVKDKLTEKDYSRHSLWLSMVGFYYRNYYKIVQMKNN